MRLIDADTLHIAIIEKGQANERGKYIVGDIWELTGAEIGEVIDSQPTINPEQHWIPVTERLPDNSRNVLITSRGGVSMAWYNGSYFEKGANTHHRKMQTVTAWCELPEPYKGVTE